MGVKGLMEVLTKRAANSIRELKDISDLKGEKIAIDGDLSIYQFMTAIPSHVKDHSGHSIAHLSGFFFRTIKMLCEGVKPVYIFDGGVLKEKEEELLKKKNEDDLKDALELGDDERVEKLRKRVVHVGKEEIDDAIRLLKLLGVPVIIAPNDAEALAASLSIKKRVQGVVTEDMDALAFGCPRLLRHLSIQSKKGIVEINLQTALKELQFTMDQFVDFCILLGCDYSETIKGIGPVSAFDLITKHKNIEEILKHLDAKKHTVPNTFNYQEARRIFRNAEKLEANVTDDQLDWREPDEDELLAYLVGERKFNEQRIRSALNRLKNAKRSGSQSKLTQFFQVTKKREESEQISKSPNVKKPKKL